MLISTIFFALNAGASLPPQPIDPSPTEVVRYYVGVRKVTSPDGAIPYSEVGIAMKRTVSPEKNRIVEETVCGGGSSERISTTYERVGASAEFSIIEDDVESGTMRPTAGDLWQWTEWKTAAVMRSGSVSTGSATVTEAGLRVERLVRTARETPLYRQTEELRFATGEEYRRKVTELLGEEPQLP